MMSPARSTPSLWPSSMAASRSCSLTMPASLRPSSTTGTAPNPLIMSEAITSPFVLRRTNCTRFSITCLTVIEPKSLTGFFLPCFFFGISSPPSPVFTAARRSLRLGLYSNGIFAAIPRSSVHRRCSVCRFPLSTLTPLSVCSRSTWVAAMS